MQVPLGRGVFALVDAEDADRVLAFSWRVKSKPDRPGYLYVQRTVQIERSGRLVKTNELLHHFIVGAAPGELVDHKSGNGLDNRKDNLRRATHRENSTNVTSSKRQKLGGYKGVTWNKAANKWQASICAGEIKPNGKRRQLYLGVFDDPAEAARAYDREALAKFGAFASLNFPVESREEADFANALAESSERGRALAEAGRSA